MMQRKLVGIFLVCVVLLVAIVAGYWDMLQSERLRISNPPESVAGTDAVSQATSLDAPPRTGAGERAATAGGETPTDVHTRAPGASRVPGVPAAQAPDGEIGAESGAAERAQASPADAGSPGAPTDVVAPPETMTDAAARRSDSRQAAPAAATTDQEAPAASGAGASPALREAKNGAASAPSDQTVSDPSDAFPGDTVQDGESATEIGAPQLAATQDAAQDDGAARGVMSEAVAPADEAVDVAAAPGIAGADDARPGDGAAETTPRFDLLRVEPDGATVIAGRAAPGSRIALRDGEAILGTDTANAAGEFAIALAAPLAAGDHAIRIVAIGADGATATSEEIAIVSVPQPGRESELLAMVEAPNEPSRLISIPGGEPVATTAAGPSPAGAGSGAVGAEATAPSGTRLATPTADPDAPDADTVTLPRAQAPAGPPALPSVPMLRVEAVEIEAGRVFVAGAAEAGSLVRVYIDNVLLAEDRATPAGRFLVSADAAVAPGDHVVRADQLTRDGSVAERAEVPFQRPEGPSVAMVAPPPARGTGPTVADEAVSGEATVAAAGTARPAPSVSSAPPASVSLAPSASSPSGPAAADRLRTPSEADDTAAEAAPTGHAADVPDGEASAEPGDAASQGVQGLIAGTAAPDDAAGDEMAMETAADDAPRSMAATSDDRGAVRPDGTPAPAALAEAPASVDAPASPSVPTGEAASSSPDSSDAAASQEMIPTTRQQALTMAPGRVIIRRGDTLWRISRENYGYGSRYVVIYLANGDQIRDPDLIYPGQVFSVPEERVDTSDAGGSF